MSKISLTAKLVVLIKSENNKKYNIFLSKSDHIKYKIIKLLFPKFTQKIITWRNNISNEIDKQIKIIKPKRVIELGAGYSLRNLDYPQIEWIDSDLPNITENKIKQLTPRKKSKTISLNMLKDKIEIKEKTLIIIEGVTSYFNKNEFQQLLNNIKKNKKKDTLILSHEPLKLSIKGFNKIRLMLSKITKSNSKQKFKTKFELQRYLEKNNFKIKKIYVKYNNIFYLIN